MIIFDVLTINNSTILLMSSKKKSSDRRKVCFLLDKICIRFVYTVCTEGGNHLLDPASCCSNEHRTSLENRYRGLSSRPEFGNRVRVYVIPRVFRDCVVCKNSNNNMLILCSHLQSFYCCTF